MFPQWVDQVNAFVSHYQQGELRDDACPAGPLTQLSQQLDLSVKTQQCLAERQWQRLQIQAGAIVSGYVTVTAAARLGVEM